MGIITGTVLSSCPLSMSPSSSTTKASGMSTSLLDLVLDFSEELMEPQLTSFMPPAVALAVSFVSATST